MRRGGFTLLELLLTSAILTILFGVVGSVTLGLLRTESARIRQTDHQSIVRQWTEIMNNDFCAAIQDTEQLNKTVGEETIRHFGLSGTATQLRIDISNYSLLSADASELRTVFYGFQQADGLVRREQDYSAEKSVPGTFQNAPEIVSGQFRYYDGNTWHEHWTSLDRKRMPSAVEVTFYSLPFAETERWRNQTPDMTTPTLTRVVVQIPSSSQQYSESYQREQPPKPPEENTPPTPPASPSPAQPQPPPPPSPFHSFFGDS